MFLVLALAQAGSGSSCHWAFPKWFGCVLAAHENLAGGLIGLAGVLLGAWAAWSAVEQQINADRERAMADRVEADRLLSESLTDYADGMAAAWRRLVALPEDADQDTTRDVYEATAYMAERLSRSERIVNYRAMADTLGWDRRMKYGALLRGLDELRQFRDPKSIQDDPQAALDLIRRLADDFEYCLPDTSRYFEGAVAPIAQGYDLRGLGRTYRNARKLSPLHLDGDREMLLWRHCALPPPKLDRRALEFLAYCRYGWHRSDHARTRLHYSADGRASPCRTCDGDGRAHNRGRAGADYWGRAAGRSQPCN